MDNRDGGDIRDHRDNVDDKDNMNDKDNMHTYKHITYTHNKQTKTDMWGIQVGYRSRVVMCNVEGLLILDKNSSSSLAFFLYFIYLLEIVPLFFFYVNRL